MSIYLYFNTGSVNHGCEAIVRATCSLIDKIEINTGKVLVTYKREQDKRFLPENAVNFIQVDDWKSQLQHAFYGVLRRVTGNRALGMKILYGDFLKKVKEDDLCLAIGGDTYCYGYPFHLEYCLDEIKKKNAKAVLWCASIEEALMKPRMVSHLKKYDLILAREQLTYEALIRKGIDENKVIHTCDPAFWLETEKTLLPDIFEKNDVIGLNVSGLLTGEESEKGNQAFNTVLECLKNILDGTSYSVCLIPHCYGTEAYGKDDVYYSEKLYNALTSEQQKRVSVVREEMSCVKLKYIISKCRFFIGARTHSIIAAYSSSVPAIALGYSVKSKGIAMDLFGQAEKYVLNADELQTPEKLTASIDFIMKNEAEIKENYEKVLPEYKDTILTAVKQIVSDMK